MRWQSHTSQKNRLFRPATVGRGTQPSKPLSCRSAGTWLRPRCLSLAVPVYRTLPPIRRCTAGRAARTRGVPIWARSRVVCGGFPARSGRVPEPSMVAQILRRHNISLCCVGRGGANCPKATCRGRVSRARPSRPSAEYCGIRGVARSQRERTSAATVNASRVEPRPAATQFKSLLCHSRPPLLSPAELPPPARLL